MSKKGRGLIWGEKAPPKGLGGWVDQADPPCLEAMVHFSKSPPQGRFLKAPFLGYGELGCSHHSLSFATRQGKRSSRDDRGLLKVVTEKRKYGQGGDAFMRH